MGAALALAAAMPLEAQSWPAKPIRLVVVFPTGSASDTYTRMITDRLPARLGQPIVIENRPGAGGLVGGQFVAGQAADGYTLLALTPQMVIRTAAPNPPFDVRKDFAHIIQNSDTPFFLAVNAEKVPARTVRELIDYIRARPGEINFTSYGAGALGHLSLELFAQMHGLKVVHVPFNGSVANSLALARGDGHATFDVLTSLRPHAESGKVRIIAAATADRNPFVPNLPGMRESGVSGFHSSSNSGISGPAGLPKEAIEKLNTAVNAVLREPAVIEQAQRFGLILVGGTSEHWSEVIDRGVATWARVIREAKITIEN
jgi:tripartite-type tricarboxylate transporter receptor subunit TctC